MKRVPNMMLTMFREEKERKIMLHLGRWACSLIENLFLKDLNEFKKLINA